MARMVTIAVLAVLASMATARSTDNSTTPTGSFTIPTTTDNCNTTSGVTSYKLPGNIPNSIFKNVTGISALTEVNVGTSSNPKTLTTPHGVIGTPRHSFAQFHSDETTAVHAALPTYSNVTITALVEPFTSTPGRGQASMTTGESFLTTVTTNAEGNMTTMELPAITTVSDMAIETATSDCESGATETEPADSKTGSVIMVSTLTTTDAAGQISLETQTATTYGSLTSNSINVSFLTGMKSVSGMILTASADNTQVATTPQMQSPSTTTNMAKSTDKNGNGRTTSSTSATGGENRPHSGGSIVTRTITSVVMSTPAVSTGGSVANQAGAGLGLIGLLAVAVL